MMRWLALLLPLIMVACFGPGTKPADSWQQRITADVNALHANQPETLATLRTLAPRRTRASTLRMMHPLLRDTLAASVLLDRLVNTRLDDATRAAMIEALPRTGGLYADAVVDLFDGETSARVRAAMIATLIRAEPTLAALGLARGLRDVNAGVRAEAARAVGRHRRGDLLSAELLPLLRDSDSAVRAQAARSFGLRRIVGALDKLAPLADDPTANVRLEALRAMRRIDPGFARRVPAVHRLRTDTDPRVRREAHAL